MKLIISRKYTSTETQGLMLVLDDFKVVSQCVCLELPQLGNQHNISCIPEGSYDVEKITRPNKDKAFLLTNVPNRTAIEIHIGNYAVGKKVDTEGCILPGMRMVDINNDGNIDVAESTIAMNILLLLLPDKFRLTVM